MQIIAASLIFIQEGKRGPYKIDFQVFNIPNLEKNISE